MVRFTVTSCVAPVLLLQAVWRVGEFIEVIGLGLKSYASLHEGTGEKMKRS